MTGPEYAIVQHDDGSYWAAPIKWEPDGTFVFVPEGKEVPVSPAPVLPPRPEFARKGG